LTRRSPSHIFTHVGEYSENALDAIFFGLSHKTRRRIVRRLSKSAEVRVTDLARSYRLSLNTVSKHIKILERSRLVRRTIVGREHYIHLDPTRLHEIEEWLNHYRQFWNVQLDGLVRSFERKRKEAPNVQDHHASR
jgi:DNA-binding transcriptional ArsR family regulator